MGSVIKKRRKRMAKKKHKKLLKKTRIQRRNAKQFYLRGSRQDVCADHSSGHGAALISP